MHAMLTLSVVCIRAVRRWRITVCVWPTQGARVPLAKRQRNAQRKHRQLRKPFVCWLDDASRFSHNHTFVCSLVGDLEASARPAANCAAKRHHATTAADVAACRGGRRRKSRRRQSRLSGRLVARGSACAVGVVCLTRRSVRSQECFFPFALAKQPLTMWFDKRQTGQCACASGLCAIDL